MRIKLSMIGKTDEKFIREGIAFYQKRVAHFSKIEWQELPSSGKGQQDITQFEGEQLLKHMQPRFTHVLLDESGKLMDSEQFAVFLEKQFVQGKKGIHFFIGGAYGFSQAIRDTADTSISLSPMTFSHQLVRLVALEQIYRALSIINNHPYHNA